MPSQNAGAADWGIGVTAVMLVIPTAMSECLTHTHSTQPPDQKENGLLNRRDLEKSSNGSNQRRQVTLNSALVTFNRPLHLNG